MNLTLVVGPWAALATVLAVGLAIDVMHELKCVHPPGGAIAFTAVMTGDAIRELGFHVVWQPVMLNRLVMLGLAVANHWLFPWRRYPASLIRRPKTSSPTPSKDAAAAHDQVVRALRANAPGIERRPQAFGLALPLRGLCDLGGCLHSINPDGPLMRCDSRRASVLQRSRAI